MRISLFSKYGQSARHAKGECFQVIFLKGPQITPFQTRSCREPEMSMKSVEHPPVILLEGVH